MAQENQQNPQEDSDGECDEKERTLFCGNLDEKVTEELLYEIFLQAGPIESARIPKDYNGRQRPFGFVTYVHKLTLPYALQLYQGLSLYRKPININYKGGEVPKITNTNTAHCSNERSDYNSTLLRGYFSSNDSAPPNPFKTNYSPENLTQYFKQQENVLRHATERRKHINSRPYQRSSEYGNRDREKERDNYRRRNYNNESNRHSDQRYSDKNRR